MIPRTMCAERLGQFVTLALVFATLDPARGTDSTNPPEGPQDRGSQQKGRLSLQNTGKRVRPAARSCRGWNRVHARSAPGAFRPKPATRAHPGRHKLLVARDVQREERGEARSCPGCESPESARASRVMK